MNTISGSSENPLGITLVNVRYILAGSVILKEQDCTQECVQFIRDNLTLANCLSFFTFGVSSCQDLCQELLPFIWKNIEELGTRREFHTLSVHEIKCLLPSSAKDPIRGADAEEAKLLSELFMGIYKWSSVDPQCRMPHFAEISSQFPLSIVDDNVLRQVFMEDCCKLSPLRGEADDRELEPLTTPSIQLSLTDGASFSSGGKICKDSSVQKETVGIRRSNRKIKRLNYSEECVDDEIKEPARTDERSKGKICTKAKGRPRLRKLHETSSTPLSNSDESSYCGVSSSQSSSSAESKRNNCELQEIDGYLSQSLNSVETSLQTCGKLSVESWKAEVLETVSPKDIIPVVDLTVGGDGGTLTPPVPQVMYFVSKPPEGNHELMVMDLKAFKIRKVHDFPDGMDCIYLLYHHMYIFAMCTKISTRKEEQCQVLCCIDLTGKIRQFQVPIRHPRFNCDWILANHGIYVLGGFNKEFNLSARVQRVQTIRPDLQLNLDRKRLRKPRADHAVVLLRGDIYIVGGLVSGKNGPKLTASMEVFSCHKVMCMKKSRMPTKRRGLCVVVVNSFLYAIGGGLEDPGTDNELNTCEVYNPDTDKWTVAAPLIQARQNASAFVMDGNIVIVGGNQGPPTMEKYDIRSNKWTLMENCSLPPGGYYKSVAFANY
ncbi:unnamed protein product [Allacma fusca]|uniref:Uncharacterized protein n=1 Tax=Allacma fusca TaxID=39272 RepID=A0A8J2NI58_9HEXA|nr:unnamed protein product [Allacma fusca]